LILFLIGRVITRIFCLSHSSRHPPPFLLCFNSSRQTWLAVKVHHITISNLIKAALSLLLNIVSKAKKPYLPKLPRNSNFTLLLMMFSIIAQHFQCLVNPAPLRLWPDQNTIFSKVLFYIITCQLFYFFLCKGPETF